MKLSRLSPQQYRRMPWKNGLGVTTEIARFPLTGDDFDWRVSIADVVSDGPFSRFDGFDRIIVTIAGEGMILDHPAIDASVELSPLQPYTFSGEHDTLCRLRGGAIRDFNVMTRREVFKAELSIVSLDASRRSQVRRANVIYCVEGPIMIAGENTAEKLETGETLLVESSAGCLPLTLSCGSDRGVAIVVAIERRSEGERL